MIKSNKELWDAVADHFNMLDGVDPRWNAAAPTHAWSHMNVTDDMAVHYEWKHVKKDHRLDVALHFEYRPPASNPKLVQHFVQYEEALKSGTDRPLHIGAVSESGHDHEVAFKINYEGEFPNEAEAKEAAELMAHLIDVTFDKLKPLGVEVIQLDY